MQKSTKAIVLGILSAIFFASTFVINRLLSLEGGSWIWTASLRFYWMLPFFLIIVGYRKNLKPLLIEIKNKPIPWIIWSTVGFGFFYTPLSFAAGYIPSWLVASTWQITIIAGIIIAPCINDKTEKIPVKVFVFSGIILLGIVAMQINELKNAPVANVLFGTVWIILAAFAYPLGNRKMMKILNGRLDVYQRILGMTICSLPFWIVLNIYGMLTNEPNPTESQYINTLIVAVVSGVIATILFFSATDLVRNDEKSLAGVEATQSTEVLFALVGEMIILESPLPDEYALIGIALVIVGMILHSLNS